MDRVMDAEVLLKKMNSRVWTHLIVDGSGRTDDPRGQDWSYKGFLFYFDESIAMLNSGYYPLMNIISLIHSHPCFYIMQLLINQLLKLRPGTV